jgi:beta-ribofuranosylaminobenzene 5'-phosphate synthase
LGRVNGGFGVALNDPSWTIEGLSDKEEDKTLEFIELYSNTLSVIDHFAQFFNKKIAIPKIVIKQSLPAHVGLGSHTQFLLALGTILAKQNNIDASVRTIAEAVQRGGTSGIGVGAFESGGFILDGGHTFGPGKQKESFSPSSASYAPPPPVLFRNYPPEEWRFILLTPEKDKGASGKKEVDLFKKECPIPAEDVEKLSRLILMKILPALVEKDIHTFGEGLTEMQTEFDRFGMEKYQQGFYHDFFAYIQKEPSAHGYGISSFGPTIFVLTENDRAAKKIIKNIKENYHEKKFQLLLTTSINTAGAKIRQK